MGRSSLLRKLVALAGLVGRERGGEVEEEEEGVEGCFRSVKGGLGQVLTQHPLGFLSVEPARADH